VIMMRPVLLPLACVIIVALLVAGLIAWYYRGQGPGISPPPGFTRSNQYTENNYTYTLYTGFSTVQEAMDAFKTEMQSSGWIFKTGGGVFSNHIGDLYEKGDLGALVSATPVGEGQVKVTVITGAKSRMTEISLSGFTADKDNYSPEESAEFTVNVNSSNVAENITVRFWGIKGLTWDFFYKDENRLVDLTAGINPVKFTFKMPTCTSCFTKDYGSGPYDVHAAVYVGNEMMDNATIAMNYDNVLEVFVFVG